jgi:hypothetical protein
MLCGPGRFGAMVLMRIPRLSADPNEDYLFLVAVGTQTYRKQQGIGIIEKCPMLPSFEFLVEKF